MGTVLDLVIRADTIKFFHPLLNVEGVVFDHLIEVGYC